MPIRPRSQESPLASHISGPADFRDQHARAAGGGCQAAGRCGDNLRIAKCERLPPHAGVLPDDSTTLSKLVSLTDERFQELIDDGTINPNMGRAWGESQVSGI